MKKKFRICKNEEFKKIRKQEHTLVNPSFVVYFNKRGLDHARFGISVSKKLGNAVVRNHIKRQIRMMLHESIDFTTYPFDAIIVARKVFNLNDYSTNKKLLEKVLNKAIME